MVELAIVAKPVKPVVPETVKEEESCSSGGQGTGNSGVAGVGECLVGQGAGDGRIGDGNIGQIIYLVGQADCGESGGSFGWCWTERLLIWLVRLVLRFWSSVLISEILESIWFSLTPAELGRKQFFLSSFPQLFVL